MMNKKSGYRVTDKYVLFWGSFLSNFEPCSIISNGFRFTSSEQMFMYGKAKLFNDPEAAKEILKSTTPAKAKSWGRRVKGFDPEVWGKYKVQVMTEAVYQKFLQNMDLRKKLLDPQFDGKKFVEASPSDTIWGIGIHWMDEEAENPENWKGQNLLGKVLNTVRTKLLEFNE